MAMRQTQKATNQAMTHWLNATPAAFQPEPSSRFTAEMAATQGVYSSVKARNPAAVAAGAGEPASKMAVQAIFQAMRAVPGPRPSR